MAFVIVVLWGDDDAAQQTTYREANDLAAGYWLARQMPLAQGRPLEHPTLAYARTVETLNDLNYPFAGPGKITQEAFQVFLSRLPPPR